MHPSPRLYLTGASCAGVSTLGAALKDTCQVPQIDVDDYYWLPPILPSPANARRKIGYG
jgi:adenylate kinase family enzyme